jgi:putative restriction endonuclease
MAGRTWSHDELMLAMNLYCQLPFGKLHARNPAIIALASALDRTPASVAMKLCNLASLDPIHQERGIRGLSKVSAADRAIWEESHADWNRFATESELLRDQILNGPRPCAAAMEPASVDSDGISPFAGESEAVQLRKVRIAQRFFRKAVVSSYDNRCCITQIGVRSLLVASHIVPWASSPQHRANPQNGLCLSRLHDAAFDRGLITLDEHYRLILSAELREATTNPVLAAAFTPYAGKPIALPQKFRPDPAFLTTHRETIFRG